MPAKATVVVTGIRGIDRKLRRLAPAVQKRVVRQAMRAGLKVLAGAVKAVAPVLLGILKKNIVVRAARKRKRGVIELEVRVNPNDQTKKASKSGKTTFYPATVQFGRKGVPANPFMSRAFASDGEKARQVTIRQLRDGVEREARAL